MGDLDVLTLNDICIGEVPCNSQLRVTNPKATITYALADYRLAARTLWGEAGEWTVDEFQRHNELYFAGELPPLPIVFGLAAYGHCLGADALSRRVAQAIPRITIATARAQRGRNDVSDRLLHEMIHAKLILASESPDHNGEPWCREIMRITRCWGSLRFTLRPTGSCASARGKRALCDASLGPVVSRAETSRAGRTRCDRATIRRANVCRSAPIKPGACGGVGERVAVAGVGGEGG